MAKKCLTKRVKKYGTGGFGADQLIQGLSGIMPVFADLSDDGKASGATIGQSIGSGLGFASNFIPGIGPIAAQAITPLLSAAGNFVGGLFDKPKKPRMKPYGYNISSGVNTGNYSFAVGGMVPAQTEVDETVYNPQTNNLDDTNAGLPHNQMGNQVTDMLSPGEYVFPSHASAPEKKRTAKQWEQVFAQLGAEDILGKLNLTRGKKYSAADLSELIDKKYTAREISNDRFAENTNQLMEQNKQQAMQVLMILNELDKQQAAPSGDIVSMALGGFIPMYGGGGSIKPLSSGKYAQTAAEYETMKTEYYYNNAVARFASWYLSQLPQGSKEPTAAEILNAFNKEFGQLQSQKLPQENPDETKKQSDLQQMSKLYQDKLVKAFPNKGYDNYPEVQDSPGSITVSQKLFDNPDVFIGLGNGEKLAKTDYWRNKTIMPYTHRTDIVRNIDGSLRSNLLESGRRGLDTSFYFNTSGASVVGNDLTSSSRISAASASYNLNKLNEQSSGKPLSDELVRAQQISKEAGYNDSVDPKQAAEFKRLEAPTMTGVPDYRYFYEEKDAQGRLTGRTIVLPAKDKKTTYEQALKEYQKTKQHYGVYISGYEEEGSLWQKVHDKLKGQPTKDVDKTVEQVKKQETKTPKTYQELKTQDPKIADIVKKISDGKPVTQEEGDYFNNEMKKAGLENAQEYGIINQGMKNQTAKAIANNSKEEGLYDYKNQKTLSPEVKAIQEKQLKGERITDKERDMLYQSSGTSSNDMTTSGAQDRINQYNDIKYKQANNLPLTIDDKYFIGLGYMQIAEDDIATGRYITNESPAEIQSIINKTARKEPLTSEEEEKLKNSQTTKPDVKATAIRNNATERTRLIAEKIDAGQEITQEEKKFVEENSNNLRWGKEVMTEKVRTAKVKTSDTENKEQQQTAPVRNPKIAKLNQKLLAGTPLTQEEIDSLWESDVSEEDRKNTIKLNTNVTADSIYGKTKKGIPLSAADKMFIQQNQDDIKGYLQDFQYTDLMEAYEGKPITSGDQYKQAQQEEIAKQNAKQQIANVQKLNPLPFNQLPIPGVKIPEMLPEKGMPGPIPDDSTTPPPNNNPTYYDMLEQQQALEGMNKQYELKNKSTYYDTPGFGTTKPYLPGNWYGPPVNPTDPWSLKTGIPVQPIDPLRGAAGTSTVIPEQPTLKLLPKGVIPQPDLSRFGTPVENNEPTFYDTPAYQEGRYNKNAEVKPFEYFSPDTENKAYPWQNQTDMKFSSPEDKKGKFGWGDPSMWAQFAGDTMALFANMRQKAPKLKGYSDAPYRALYQQMVPNIGMYDNLTDATLSQQQNALRGSVSNPSLLAASQNQQVAQGLKAMNSAALGEQQRIDQIRQSQLSGIDQIARANVQVGNENMANKVALENAKKSAIAQYGQSVAKNMAERRNMDMQNQLYAGLYENTYPYAGQVDVSQFFPRFGRAKKNNDYGG